MNTPYLQSFAYKLTRDWHLAEDLYQETAVQAFRSKDKFKEGTNQKSWLATVMRNIFINDLRKKKRRVTLVEHFPSYDRYNLTHNQGEYALAEEEILTIVNSIDNNLKLPLLMYSRGYKYNEIAEALDIPLGTLKSRISIARKKIRKKLKQQQVA